MPATLVTPYRQRAASEPPRELRRHPPEMRYTLLAALCWQRQREITDTLVELLMHIAHRVGVRAEEKVDGELMTYAKKVIGKTKLLYKLAKAAKGQPDGVVKDVIYPAVGEQTLDDLIHEAEAAEQHEHQVKRVTRASYSHHYRRIMPALLDVLAFRCNNDRHRPVMDALALLEKYRDRKTTVFPASEQVPLDGVVSDDWQDLVRDDKHGGARQSHLVRMVCADDVTREGALQGGVGGRRAPLPQPRRGRAARLRRRGATSITRPSGSRGTPEMFVETRAQQDGDGAYGLRRQSAHQPKVKIVTTKTGKGRIRFTPLEEQPEPPNIVTLTAALVRALADDQLARHPEGDGAAGALHRSVPHGRHAGGAQPQTCYSAASCYACTAGHQCGPQAHVQWGGEDSYADLQYVRRRYITKSSCARRLRRCATRFSRPPPGLVGRGHDGLRLGLEEVRGLGPEFDDRVARALRRPGRHDLLACGEELGVHLLAAQGVLLLGSRRHDRRGAAP